jgi:murein DD-endopeptidase MepM/ murein hydrolase activator NlpD
MSKYLLIHYSSSYIMANKRLVAIILFIIIILAISPQRVVAQDPAANGPVYIVQKGDTLLVIAQRFGVAMIDLEQVNGITNPNLVRAGDSLVIPGLEGIQGVLATTKVPYGETLRSLSRLYQTPLELLARLNHVTTPAELYAGANLIIPQNEDVPKPGKRAALAPGESLLELAVVQGVSPWSLVETNELSGTWDALPGDVLRLAGKDVQGPGALPGQITSVEVSPLPLVQGKTAMVQVEGVSGISLTGSLAGHELHFFPAGEGKYVALQGLHAMLTPGLYPLALTGTLADGTPLGFTQNVFVESGNYIQDLPIQVDPEGLDPNLTGPEDKQWAALAAPFTPEKMWDGKFLFPAENVYVDCYPSTFGRRRNYNNDPHLYFHTGLDICGGVGDDIYAAASGVVVWAGSLTVRGNTTMIDHGWGVYSAYMHQSEILVKVGDRVEAGQLIGKVGRTGLRITGPHLHFEMLVGDVQVDPMDWLSQAYP